MKRLIPIDPQPTYEWIRPIVDQKTGEVHAYCDKDPTRYFCPHKPGDKLPVRERFYIDHVNFLGELPSEKPANFDDLEIYYRADGTCCQQIPECACAEVGKPEWREASTMPAWAVRRWETVESIGVECLEGIWHWVIQTNESE